MAGKEQFIVWLSHDPDVVNSFLKEGWRVKDAFEGQADGGYEPGWWILLQRGDKQ